METNNRIKMKTVKTNNLEFENLTPQIFEFKLTKPDQEYIGFDNNYLILDLGEKKTGDFATSNFMFRSDEYKITSTGASCGCTKPSFQNTADGQFVTVAFDPSKITKNTSKWFTLYLNNSVKAIKINLIINK